MLIAGTNNLKSDYSGDILAEYGKLLDNAEKVAPRKTTVVGIMKRFDLGKSFESKHIVKNVKLREMCAARKIEFLGHDQEIGHMEKDRLHLNEEGQHVLAKKIFAHCLSF